MHQTNPSATIKVHVNPFLFLTTTVGVWILGSVLDLSFDITAHPELVIVFIVNGEFNVASNASVSLPALMGGLAVLMGYVTFAEAKVEAKSNEY